MFVQVIDGRTKDPEGLRQQGSSWDAEVGLPGLIGVTAGSTDDGRTISVVRFESEEAARAIQDSPEQTAWAEKMFSFYEGPPTFTESTDVEQAIGSPSNDAEFVQVMRSTGVDREQVARLDAVFTQFAHLRSDLLGVFRVWTGPDSCVDVGYFTNEAEARAGEKQELPPEMAEAMGEFVDMGETEYFDLKPPHLYLR